MFSGWPGLFVLLKPGVGLMTWISNKPPLDGLSVKFCNVKIELKLLTSVTGVFGLVMS